MDKVDLLILNIIQREGGYVDHPADKGGPTKYGITEATLKKASPNGLLSSVKDLTPVEAYLIYKSIYYTDNKVDKMPVELQDLLLDMYVLHGAKNTVQMLQKALNKLGGSLILDGILGPKTIQAVEFADPIKLRTQLNAIRKGFILAIIKRNPTQAVFEKGWLARVALFEEK